LLREAMEDMAEPDAQASAEIDAMITPAWQKALARRMEEASGGAAEPEVPAESRRGWLDWLRLPMWAYPVAATAMAAVIVGIVAWPAWQLHQVNELTLEAYAEKRQIDFQLPGAPYTPNRRERGAGSERPAALAEAESIAAEQLESHPGDPRWLAARGRIDLLAGDYGTAIERLELALAKLPDSETVQIDLAAAYYQRAQTDDYQKAYDLLSKVLSKKPDSAAALYNRALAAQGLKFRGKAVEDWNHYLRLDSNGSWADEARRQLQVLR
jgi:tetratricopeptide (TPR) repeat protein